MEYYVLTTRTTIDYFMIELTWINLHYKYYNNELILVIDGDSSA